jgi:hypothetical protein
MERQILHQRFEFAEIQAFKNYSKLTKKRNPFSFDIDEVIESPDEDEFHRTISSIPNEVQRSIYQDNGFYTLRLDENDSIRKNNKTKYFYSGENGVGVITQIEPFFKKDNTFFTTNDRHIKNHYARPFSSIGTNVFERTIYIKDNKITIKKSIFTKSRHINCKYFKKNWFRFGITIDLKTGNITSYHTNKSGANKVRRNSFREIHTSLLSTEIMSFGVRVLRKFYGDRKSSEILRNECLDIINDYEFIKELKNTFSSIEGFSCPDVDLREPKDWFMETLIRLFVHLKKIKVPNNNYESLIFHWYPTKKYLIKNDNKLIASILDRFGVKSKKTIKILHENPGLPLNYFTELKEIFGERDFHKYIGNIDPNLFGVSSSDNNLGIDYNSIYQYPDRRLRHMPDHVDLTNDEKSNLFKFLNDNLSKSMSDRVDHVKHRQHNKKIIDDTFREIRDHIRMLGKVKIYFPDTKIRATNQMSFHQEHLEFARLERIIGRGYNVEFVFDERMVEYIEEPIINGDGIFHPVILKKDCDYTDEGTHMHHCVGGYAENENSLIVSLRMNDRIGKERITCEFSTFDKNCVQARHFCNATPPDHFNSALLTLKEKIKNYNYPIKSKEKIRTPLLLKDGQVFQPERTTTEQLFHLINNMGNQQLDLF